MAYTKEMDETLPAARVLRALTSDAAIRMAAVDAGPLWDGVRRGHPHLEAEACAVLTELMAATLLLQSRGLFAERIQLLLRSAGRAKSAVADAWPDGAIRSVLDLAETPAEPAWIAAPGLFQVMRSPGRGEPFVGKLPLVDGGVAAQVEHYLQQSEQVQASLTLWCDPGSGEAGGLLVEPLPACPRPRLHRLVDALEGLEVVPTWERDPEFLLRWVNQGGGFDLLSTTEVTYRCRCTREALLETLRGFPEDQRTQVFAPGSPVDIRCDYCGKVYAIAREEVLGGGEEA